MLIPILCVVGGVILGILACAAVLFCWLKDFKIF